MLLLTWATTCVHACAWVVGSWNGAFCFARRTWSIVYKQSCEWLFGRILTKHTYWQNPSISQPSVNQIELTWYNYQRKGPACNPNTYFLKSKAIDMGIDWLDSLFKNKLASLTFATEHAETKRVALRWCANQCNNNFIFHSCSHHGHGIRFWHHAI